MKHLAAILCFLVCGFCTQTLKAQSNITNDYVVISTADVPSSVPYTDAMDAANWEPFRLQNIRYQLTFDNGFTIELKSAVELLNLGYPLNLNNYQTSLPEGYVAPTLKLMTGNVIGMETHSSPSKTNQ